MGIYIEIKVHKRTKDRFTAIKRVTGLTNDQLLNILMGNNPYQEEKLENENIAAKIRHS